MKESGPRAIKALSADELRDKLPNSGVFEMFDCKVEVFCPLNSDTSEIEKIVKVIESMINVTDVKITGDIGPEDQEHYIIKITDTPVNTNIARGRTKR
jgi:hypothetical protein